MDELLTAAQGEYEQQSFAGLKLEGEEIRFKEFYGCQFTECSFLETTFGHCKFVDCEFADCDLSLCRVKGCTFSNTVFTKSQVVGVNWTEASWPRGGLLRGIDFFDCAISHSTFLGLSLRQISICGCVAHNADFAEADLSRATCTGTDFADSRFLQTDLTEADFAGARNYAISPNMNVLKKARFSLPEAISLLYGLDIVLSE
jgi:uncharacterized protein YjbI with pentapeptide repeats